MEGYPVDVGQAVLDFLEHFRRPSSALWTGLSSAGTDEGFIGGAKKGWYLEPGSKELSDVFGMEGGKEDDPWADWALKEGGKIAVDAIGDPLTYLFAPAKAKGIIGPAVKALGVPEGRSLVTHAAAPITEKIATKFESSPWFKQVGHRLSTLPEFEEELQRIGREGSSVPVRKQAEELRLALGERLTDLGEEYTPAKVFDALERKDDITDPVLRELVDMVEPLRALRDETWNRKNNLREAVGFERKASINEPGYYQMPRVATDETTRRLLRLGDASVNPEAWKDASREIFRWVDEEGNVRHIGKANDKALRRVVDEGEERFLHEGVPVTRKQASLSDVAPIMGERSFIDHPVTALERQILRDQAQINMLEMLQSGVDRGWITHAGLRAPLEGQRPLRMRPESALGKDPWELYSADPRVANRLENIADSGEGLVFDLLDRIGSSKLGQVGNQLQDLWKREILTNLGFYTGNAVSNVGLLYNDGVAAHKIIPRILDAIKVRTGAESQVFSSRTNQDILDFLEKSNVTKTGWAGTLEKQHALEQTVGDFLPDKTPGKAMIQTGAKKWDEAKDWLFKNLGSEPEDNAKVARFIDYIKENYPRFDILPRNEQDKIMDKAVLRAKDALVDYTNLAPTEKRAQFFVPFLAWMRGIGGLTAEQGLTRPDRFGRQARFLDSIFEPLPQEEKAQADPWVNEGAPVTGFMGSPFPKDERGNQNMLLLGRYLPQGQFDQALKRPGSFLTSALTPLVKTPGEAIANYSLMREEPIDREAKGILGQLTAPITGDLYEKNRGYTLGAQLPAGWQHILDSSPISRHVRTMNDIARGLGLTEDPYKPAPSDTDIGSRLGGTFMQTVTGSRFYGYDPEKYQRKRKLEKDREKRQIRSNLRWARNIGADDATDFYQNQLMNFAMNPNIFLEDH